jgi:predicted pyridoxine 5'-phosphate oxidase superfamily flavin-nucleotide-binding protein
MIDAGQHTISSTAQLRELFGEPLPRVVTKEMPGLDAQTTAFIAAAPFLVMATTGADGSCDAGPKGGPPGFVRVLTDTRLLIPSFPAIAASTVFRTSSRDQASACSSSFRAFPRPCA